VSAPSEGEPLGAVVDAPPPGEAEGATPAPSAGELTRADAASPRPAATTGPAAEPLTYASYLRLHSLLSLQHPRTSAHDELQFIIVHQVFELWFRLLAFELAAARDAIAAGTVPRARLLLRRASEVVKILISIFPVLETMRPASFLEFRSQLGGASGVQSHQFREIEFLAGARDTRFLRLFRDDPEAQRALERRLAEPSLWDAFVELLARAGHPVTTREEILETLVRIHQDQDPVQRDLDDLAEALLEFDSRFALWRTRHLLMVERMIGSRPGTGRQSLYQVAGDPEMPSGSVYLQGTLGKRFFPLIWESRTYVGK
jgi:tryptophan 2,3-dioxygenase